VTRLTCPLDELLAADFGEWQPLLRRWRASAAGQALVTAVDERVAAGAKVYPAQVFRALALTPMSSVRVLILGQDPYHGPGQAEGLAFSVAPGQRLPPSLRNIFKELQRDLGLAMPASGSLAPWARQGVLLLNATLTVEDGLAGRHAKLGWQALTDEICKVLARDPEPKVFMLWGTHAQANAPLLQPPGARHTVLACNHPSPLSALRPPAPFLGCGHFGLANAALQQAGRPAVDWRLGSTSAVI
jgi:uracil-DNA glycosylase